MIKVFVVALEVYCSKLPSKESMRRRQVAEPPATALHLRDQMPPVCSCNVTVTLEPVHSCLSWDTRDTQKAPPLTLLRVSQGFILT